jgi:uncharacterized protein (TIGR04255 family)
MALDFGPHDDVVFEHAPLISVLCQVRFPAILSLTTRVGATGFQEGLREEYPDFLPPAQNTAIQLSDQGSIGINQMAPVWRLQDRTKAWTVGIGADFVSLETPKYTSIDEFLARFDLVLQVLRRTLRPADSLRIGMRKVNFIRVDDVTSPGAFIGVIRPDLLGALAVTNFPAPVVGSSAYLQFEDDDNVLAVRYGTVESGEPDHETGFLIDLDYSTTWPYTVGAGSDMVLLLREFSDGMTSFFHWAIDPAYVQQLSPIPRKSSNHK